MQAQASREDRVRAVTATITRQDLGDRLFLGSTRLPHDIARALAEQVVDAVVEADQREIRKDQLRSSPFL